MTGTPVILPPEGTKYDSADRLQDGKTVVLCVGNRFMRDDGLGPAVFDRLNGSDLGTGVALAESPSADLPTVWEFRFARKLVVVDAVRSGDRPGTVSKHLVVPGESPPRGRALHDLDLGGVVGLAASAGANVPVVVVGVEPKDCSPGEGLSEEVAAAVPLAVEAVLSELTPRGSVRCSGDE